MARFVVCTSKSLGDVSGDDLTIRKVDEVVAEENGMYRVVDDSGEDYLYPAAGFEEVVVSDDAAKRLHDALRAQAA